MRRPVARCYASGGPSVAYGPVAEWLRSAGLQARMRSLDGIWRGEAARLLPELLSDRPDLPAPGPMTETWQRQRFFQALARAVLGAAAGDSDKPFTGLGVRPDGTDPPEQEPGGNASPLLLLLDDVQWCDHDTLDWLQYLIQAAAVALCWCWARCEVRRPVTITR